MGEWKTSSGSLDDFGIILLVLLLVYLVANLIFRYLIYIKKLKPSKLSRQFYSDDESFVKSWQSIQDKGILKYILKNIIISIVMMSIMGMFYLLNKVSLYGYEQGQTLVVALSSGFILGLISSLIGWGIQQERYSKLKDKEKVDE